MALIEWNEECSVGVARMDQQHRRLFEMLNELGDAMKERRGREVVGTVLDKMLVYTRTHFADEEELMEEHDCPELAQQKIEHAYLTTQAESYQQRYIDGEEFIAAELMHFLKDWLLTHTQGTDRKYGRFLNERGVR
jgi:hemerythrin